MKLVHLLLACLLATAALSAAAQNFVPVPPLQARVTDQAGMLNAQQRAALENVLAEYEGRTGSQIAIMLVDSTAPEAIEQYSIRVADAWKIGRKGVDDGVILMVAKNNPPALRRLRIEVGLGAQGVLTDAQSKRILQDVIAPHFRQNDFYGGLAAGVSAIAALLDKESFAAPDDAAAALEKRSGTDLFTLLPIIFLLIVFFGTLRSPRWTQSQGVILGGGLGGGSRGSWGGSSGGGGFSGGGGGFSGGGASGNW
jgi:uncharacterized protein